MHFDLQTAKLSAHSSKVEQLKKREMDTKRENGRGRTRGSGKSGN